MLTTVLKPATMPMQQNTLILMHMPTLMELIHTQTLMVLLLELSKLTLGTQVNPFLSIGFFIGFTVCNIHLLTAALRFRLPFTDFY